MCCIVYAVLITALLYCAHTLLTYPFLYQNCIYRQKKSSTSSRRTIVIGKLPESSIADNSPFIPPSQYTIRLNATAGLGLNLEIANAKVHNNYYAYIHIHILPYEVVHSTLLHSRTHCLNESNMC